MKKFLVSVADVWGYATNGDLLFIGKTLLDSSIETALNATDVRAGRGAPLEYVYYNSPDMNITISDAQWNLDFLAVAVGASVATGANVYTEETVTLGAAGAGTVLGTPIAVSGATIYGWMTNELGVVEKVTFTGSNFASSGAQNDVVCVRYYALDAAARSIVVPANVVPSIVRLVMEAQLASSDSTTNVIGKVTIEVPKASLTGSFSISMTPDGVASTPLAARALPNLDSSTGACTNAPYLARISETITGANWYDNILGLAIGGGDFALTHPATKQLVVYAIPTSGAAFIPPVADLTFSSGTVGTATISAGGLVTTVAAGTSLLKATVTAATQYDANVTVTVS